MDGLELHNDGIAERLGRVIRDEDGIIEVRIKRQCRILEWFENAANDEFLIMEGKAAAKWYLVAEYIFCNTLPDDGAVLVIIALGEETAEFDRLL